MAEFIQSYGIVILIGLLFSLMLWRSIRGKSVGCCGGGHQHVPEKVIGKEQQETNTHNSGGH